MAEVVAEGGPTWGGREVEKIPKSSLAFILSYYQVLRNANETDCQFVRAGIFFLSGKNTTPLIREFLLVERKEMDHKGGTRDGKKRRP